MKYLTKQQLEQIRHTPGLVVIYTSMGSTTLRYIFIDGVFRQEIKY